MDNSFHSDNSICPINIISQALSFLASFRSRQIQIVSMSYRKLSGRDSAEICGRSFSNVFRREGDAGDGDFGGSFRKN